MTGVTNILFDFGNVLNDLDIEESISRLNSLRNPDLSEPDYMDDVMEAIGLYDVGTYTTEDFIEKILGHCANNITAEDIIEAWNSMLIGIPSYRLGLLQQLHARYGIYILSNTNELHIEWVYQHLQQIHNMSGKRFEEMYFNNVYYSHKIGLRKPDVRAFQYVLEDSLITAENTLFIDDLIENIEVAASLGFKTLHSPAEEEIANTLKLQGYY